QWSRGRLVRVIGPRYSVTFRVAGKLVLREDAAETERIVGNCSDGELVHDVSRHRDAVEGREFLCRAPSRLKEIHPRARLALQHSPVIVSEEHRTLNDRGPDQRRLDEVDDGGLT